MSKKFGELLKQNQTRYQHGLSMASKQPKMTNALNICNIEMVNYTHVIMIQLTQSKFEDALESLKTNCHYARHTKRPFTQHEFVILSHSIMISPFKESANRDIIRVNVLGPISFEIITNISMLLTHLLITSGHPVGFCEAYRVNRVVKIKLVEKGLVDLIGYYRDVKDEGILKIGEASFPGANLQFNDGIDRGVSIIRIFQSGNVNFLGVELSTMIKFLHPIVQKILKHSTENMATTVQQRKIFRDIAKMSIE